MGRLRETEAQREKKNQDGKDRNDHNNNIMCAYSTQVNVQKKQRGGGKKHTGDQNDSEMERR